VHAADAVIDNLHTWACDVFGDMAHHLGAETVVAEEDVADTGYQNLGRDATSQKGLHPPHLQVPLKIRQGADAHHDRTEHYDAGYHGGRYTYCLHDGFLSLNGSTSSGAKYR
jgi:hypothetical protein